MLRFKASLQSFTHLYQEVGPEGRGTTVVVEKKEEVEALQLHGCFGLVVDVKWRDTARLVMEDWRPGEEEEEQEQEEPQSWADVKERREEKEEKVREVILHLELCEAFFLSYALGCLTVEQEDRQQLGLLDMWTKYCQLEDDFPLRC